MKATATATITLLDNRQIIVGTATAEKDIDNLKGDILISRIDSDIEYISDSCDYILNYFKYIEGSADLLKRLNNWLLQLKENIYEHEIDIINALHSNCMIKSHKVEDIVNQIEDIAYYYIDYIKDNTDFNIGHYAVNELEIIEVPEHIEPYFDYECYGRNLRLSGQVKVLNEELIILNWL